MINAKFYNFAKKINSTKQPADSDIVFSDTICFLEPTSFMNPAIKINRSSFNPSSINYVWIDGFGYYFITGSDWVDGCWQFSLKYDSLANCKTNIAASTQFVTRTSVNSNGYITDNMYPVTAEKSVSRVTSSINLGIDYVLLVPQFCYIIGIINNSGDSSVGCVSYYAFSDEQFYHFKQWLLDRNSFTDVTDFSIFNPFQFIVSCIAVPFNVSGGEDIFHLKFGWWQLDSNDPDHPICTGSFQNYKYYSDYITLPSHPQIVRGDFLNVEPYSHFYFESKSFGIIPIDMGRLLGISTLYLNVDVEIRTGKALFYWSKRTGTSGNYVYTVLGQQEFELGVPIQLSNISYNMMDVVNGYSSLFGGLGQVATGNIVGGISSIANGVLSTAAAYAPKQKSIGSNGSFIKIEQNSNFETSIILVAEFYKVTDEDNADKGRPYCRNIQLNNNGYYLCSDAHPEFGCNTEVRDEIKNYMEGGFFYE